MPEAPKFNGHYRHIIFDWDGTLIDSIPRIVDCFHKSFAALSLALLPDERIKSLIGLPLANAFKTLVPKASEDTASHFVDIYRDFWRDPQLPLSPLFPGVEDLLDALAQMGIVLAIATGKSREGLERELDFHNLHHRFRATRCAGEVQPKPQPDMLLQLVAELTADPKQTLMIGDTTLDLDMANNAGIAAVAVTSGGHPKSELMTSKPIACFDTITELTAWLGQ